MKIVQLLVIIFLTLTLSCTQKVKQNSHYLTTNDTIILKMERIKGYGMFQGGAGQMHFVDTTYKYYFPHKFPKNVNDIKFAFQHIDFKPFLYKRYKEGKMDTVQFLSYVYDNKIDTLNVPSLKDNSISFMSGFQNNERILIVDQNNNKDFRDDSIRHYHVMDWKTISKLIICKFKIYNGENLKIDSTWVNIGTLHGDELWFSVSHHLVSTFSIEQDEYQIGIFDGQSNFDYDEPTIALISQNGIVKDSLIKSEIFNKGEYLKLGDNYFFFENITNDGSYVTLIRDNNFFSKVGTQVGMIAPEFCFKSINGDTINSTSFKNKTFLIANISGCTLKSYDEYKSILKASNSELMTIGIECGIKEDIGGIMLDVNDKYNSDMYNKYRNAYSSYDCFLINAEGRIIDKFNIFYWKKHLSSNSFIVN